RPGRAASADRCGGLRRSAAPARTRSQRTGTSRRRASLQAWSGEFAWLPRRNTETNGERYHTDRARFVNPLRAHFSIREDSSRSAHKGAAIVSARDRRAGSTSPDRDVRQAAQADAGGPMPRPVPGGAPAGRSSPGPRRSHQAGLRASRALGEPSGGYTPDRPVGWRRRAPPEQRHERTPARMRAAAPSTSPPAAIRNATPRTSGRAPAANATAEPLLRSQAVLDDVTKVVLYHGIGLEPCRQPLERLREVGPVQPEPLDKERHVGKVVGLQPLQLADDQVRRG